MDKILLFFRKFASYILFIFTLLSFLFSESETLNIIFISIAFLAFFKINFFKLFSKERYLSKLELFFSILLFIRVMLLFDLHILYKFISYFMGIFFLLAYFVSFSNIKAVDTNLLGIKRLKEDYSEENLNSYYDDESDKDLYVDEDDDAFSDSDEDLDVDEDDAFSDSDKDLDVDDDDAFSDSDEDLDVYDDDYAFSDSDEDLEDDDFIKKKQKTSKKVKKVNKTKK